VAVSMLDRKLLRDLWLIKGQAIAIALVIGAGVAMYVLMNSTFHSLDLTQRTYYERYRFGDVFAGLKRAPLRMADRIAAIPGVAKVESRVVVDVTLDIPGLPEPAVGRLISIPEQRRPILCDLYMRAGRWIELGRPDEVILAESFADAHGLGPGDQITAIINGRRRQLDIVGLALTPEYVYSIRPGEMLPDESRFGILWMERRALATAFDMEGGFNDVVVQLMHHASEADVISRLDRLIKPYGGLGAIPRRLQLSHFYLQNELNGLKGMGALLPMIFLGVAAFLLNVVLSRIVSVQREQIAAIKALGYSNRAVAWHYVKWALLVAGAGTVLGLAFGAWLGAAMTRMYTIFFHFPILQFELPGKIVVGAAAISLIAATLGAMGSVRRAVTLPPAEAMRPEPPARFQQSLVERAGLEKYLSQPARMILRNIERHPGRTALSVIGIGFGGALLVVGAFTLDAVNVMMDVQFNLAQRYDLMLSFVEPASPSVRHDVGRLPGVIAVEGFRTVPVRLRAGHRNRTTAITGSPASGRLNRIVNMTGRQTTLPPEGLVLSGVLGEILGVEAGDTVRVEVLEGARPIRDVTVARLVDDFLGANAYMEIDALHRLMHEGDVLSGAYVRVDTAHLSELYRTLKATPKVAGVMLKEAAIESVDRTMGEMIGMIRGINVLFAGIIAFGVVYNAARISLSERSRELATLRVIGFRRGEISYILLGELALVTLVAVPTGLLLGYGIAAATVEAFITEVWRMPLVVSPRTYAFAAVTIVIATALSAMIVRRKLNRLDLVEVLKTRE